MAIEDFELAMLTRVKELEDKVKKLEARLHKVEVAANRKKAYGPSAYQPRRLNN